MCARSVLPASVALAVLVGAAGVSGCEAPSWSEPVAGLEGVLLGVWGSAADDVWAVGGTCDPADCDATSRSLVLRFDGRRWRRVDAGVPAILWWVSGFSRDDVWIAGEKGTLLHFDGRALRLEAEGLAPGAKLFGVWGSSPRDLWAVGGRPDLSSIVLRSDGTGFRVEAGAPRVMDAAGRLGGTWYKVWGAGPDAVFLVGQRGFVVRYDGARFERLDAGGAGVVDQGLFTVAGRARDDVYVVGGDPARGVALRFDGTRLAPVEGLDLREVPQLMGVAVTPAGDVTMTGLAGAKLRRRATDGAFRDESTLAPRRDYHAVYMAGPEDVFAVGGSFFALRAGAVAHYGRAVPSTLE